jgi:DNA-directed RNA polymerase specialized sigma24 family protein
MYRHSKCNGLRGLASILGVVEGVTMSAGVIASVCGVEQPENYVPSDNKDLYRAYKLDVEKWVTRHNRVLTNYADLVQHIWLKLIEADVLGKYAKSLGHLPKLLSAQQVCTYLRLPPESFMARVQEGQEKERMYHRALDRDGGECHRCYRNGALLMSGLEVVKTSSPEHYAVVVAGICDQLGLSTLPARLWLVENREGVECTTCIFCAHQLRTAGVSYKWYPTPQRGHWNSLTALYAREDVERLRLALETENDRPVDVEADPSSVLSKSLFKQYLARAVHNFYANWCRTRDRRYKETYKGFDETTGRHWEDTLSNPFGASPDTLVDLRNTVRSLAGGGNPDDSNVELESEVIQMLDSGKSAQEVARRHGVRPRVLQALVS